jgi:hypothetical protein
MSIRQWFPATDYRSDEDEIMENPEVSRGDFVRALGEIRWVNRNLGGTAAILDTLEGLCAAEQQPEILSDALRILDLGTGSADIPMAMAEWGRAHQQKLQIIAVDLHPAAVEEARTRTASYPEIEVRQGNALALPDEPYSFDYVVSSMFMHHLSQAEAVELLRTMARLSRRGLVVNDLERQSMGVDEHPPTGSLNRQRPCISARFCAFRLARFSESRVGSALPGSRTGGCGNPPPLSFSLGADLA